ncbi:dephospho-CoA kinase [Pedobacter sp. JCM 36344]|uniref:dephospho-CoA kinase n=1 Tax=Pedobacter sp. JCM 36344 TaxID=3374280 RepID=UPI00397D8C1E
MLKIGITGGIGSGKTTVCKIFETLGIPVFYADTVAKSIMVIDPLLVAGVKKAFGHLSYFPDDSLNNKHIANIVFTNPEELAKLNELVHPAVFRAFESWIGTVDNSAPYLLKEAALLFESGSYKMCDQSILVIAPHELKLKRVMARDSVTADLVTSRMDKQFSDEQKSKIADFILYNSESQSVIAQVIDLHEQFLKN